MRKEFLVNISFLLTINLLIKPFYIFGIDRVVQNTVDTAEYGIYFALFNFTFLFQIINDFGIQNFNNRNISQHSQLLEKYFPNIISLKLILGFLYTFFVLAAAFLSGYELHYFQLLIWLIVNQFLISLIFFLRSNISGLAMYRTDSLISVLDKVLLIGICGVLLWTPSFKENFQIIWFIYAQTIAFFITALIAFIIIRKKITRLTLKLNWPFLLLILKKSYPFALVVFLMTIYSRIDAVMIERMLVDGQTEAGIYASAYRLLTASNMLGFLFAGLLLPMFSKMIKEKEPIRPLLRLSFQLIWVASISIALSTYFFRIPIMELLYTSATDYWGEVLGYLMLSFIAVSATYIHGTFLTANGSIKSMNYIFLVGVILNTSLNYFLIPEYKAMGAVVATLLTQFYVMLALMILAQRELKLNLDFSFITQLLAYAGAVTITAWSISNHLSINWILSYLITTILGLLLAFPFRLVKGKTLLGLITSSK